MTRIWELVEIVPTAAEGEVCYIDINAITDTDDIDI